MPKVLSHVANAISSVVIVATNKCYLPHVDLPDDRLQLLLVAVLSFGKKASLSVFMYSKQEV
jgi:hypothetical protein